MSKTARSEAFSLGWFDPRTKKINQAGVAFFNETYGEYFLRIDEEASEKQYFLRPYALEGEKVVYRMELALKDRNGKFVRRVIVGEGESKAASGSRIYVDYGSKFKKLILFGCKGVKHENK